MNETGASTGGAKPGATRAQRNPWERTAAISPAPAWAEEASQHQHPAKNAAIKSKKS